MKRGKQMRNLEVVKAFINGRAAKGSNLVSTGDKLINYSTTIAKHQDGKVILSSDRYSVTTSKIQSYVRRECPSYKLILESLGW